MPKNTKKKPPEPPADHFTITVKPDAEGRKIVLDLTELELAPDAQIKILPKAYVTIQMKGWGDEDCSVNLFNRDKTLTIKSLFIPFLLGNSQPCVVKVSDGDKILTESILEHSYQYNFDEALIHRETIGRYIDNAYEQ